MNNVLIISENSFPSEDAGAIRDESFAKIYQSLGYCVYEVCMSRTSKSGIYKGVEYYSLYKRNESLFQKGINFLTYKSRLKILLKQLEKKKILFSIVHLYSTHINCINYLRKWAEKKRCVLIHDSVEWYSPCEFNNGKHNIAYKIKERLNTKLIRSPFRVICISSFLQNYFSSKKLDTIRIPVIMDSNDFSPRIEARNKTNIIYAGSPANKDFLSLILNAYIKLDEKIRNKLHLYIAGVSKEQIVNLGYVSEKELDSIKESITIYGRIEHKKVLEILRDMDFSVLIRPENERYAKAGFPTKSVEAMMSGVAMLCNLTSDLGMYLVDMDNSVLVQCSDVESMISAYQRVASLTNEEILKIRRKALKTAKEFFDYNGYIDTLQSFIYDI